jgi:hypothetical protein
VCCRASGGRQRAAIAALTSESPAHQDIDNGCCPIRENFPYVFKGARSAPRAWRRVTAHATTTRELARTAESGRDAPEGNPPHSAAAALLSAKAHVGGRRGTDPGQLAAPAGRRNPPRVREQGHPPGRVIVEAEQDHPQGRL